MYPEKCPEVVEALFLLFLCHDSDIFGSGSGHLVEALMSKVGAVMGREGDATPFTEVTVDNISTTLHR